MIIQCNIFLIAIAGKYRSGRTKRSVIVGALAKEDASVITEAMKTTPYSLATDGSTDVCVLFCCLTVANSCCRC